MVTIVNYYTCCYGDSMVAMFSGNPVIRKNGIASCIHDIFIEPDFYQSVLQEQSKQLEQIVDSKHRVLPCHRQFGYDFVKTFPGQCQIITLKSSNINWLVNRFVDIHICERKKSLGNPILEKLRIQHPELTKDIVKKDYNYWLKKNLLPTDIVFDMNWLDSSNIVEKFCRKHRLNFDSAWIDNILQDRKQYEI